MSKKTRKKMKQKLEEVFNAIADTEDMTDWGQNTDDYCDEIDSLANIVEAYAKLDAIDEQQATVETIINALQKKTTPINWKV